MVKKNWELMNLEIEGRWTDGLTGITKYLPQVDW